MAFGKEITLFLIDGVHDLRIACELSNWTGKGYKIPRHLLKDTDRRDLHKAGVYFLFGRKKGAGETNIVYIGEGEDAYERLKQQHAKDDSWEEILVFVSKDDKLNKAHVKFLEYTIWAAATEAGRYLIENKSTPNCPTISESEEAVMSEFFENLKILAGTLGYKVFEPVVKEHREVSDRYFLGGPRGADAEAEVAEDDTIVVKKGSKAAGSGVPSTPDSVLKLRDDLEHEGVLRSDGESLVFLKDHRFKSASSAASVVLGRSANGLTEWRDSEGRILRESLAYR